MIYPSKRLIDWETTLKQRQIPSDLAPSLFIISLSNPIRSSLKIQSQFNVLGYLMKKLAWHMYEMAIAAFSSAMGLNRYEISAFAQPSYEFSRHNIGYWTGRPFLGLGPSAFSYWEGRRFRNIPNLSKYCKALKEGKSPVDFEEELAPDATRRELLTIRIRLLEGVDLESFQKKYGGLEADTFAALERLKSEGLIRQEGSRVGLTKRGVLFYDTVAAELV